MDVPAFAIRTAVLAAAVVFSTDARAQTRPELLGMIGQTLSGTIVSVADGDTVRARLDRGGRPLTIRLEGIDTPEQGEPFSTQARNATRVMLFNKKVQLKATDVDRYDRLVARIVIDGTDSSLQLVEAGLACHFTRFVNDPVLAKAQGSARTAGRGFWAAGAAKPACVKFTGIIPPRR
ncbi:MAG TPA: thermonuclease family protein [Vicinamibacterales bacterium]|nr:thermonuclease family protein [Vicinamibacterales bacterium]